MAGVKSFLQPCNSPPFFTLLQHKPFTNPYTLTPPDSRKNLTLISAIKKQKRGSKNLLELAEFDEIEEEDDEDDEDDEEGVFSIPLSGMTEWFDKKPSGFGQGKEYDTSVEDKLLEELEQSRKAQIVNINNLKKNPSLGNNSKVEKLPKAPEVVPSGVCVRIGNLPRKKNIQRDLQTVFKGFPAIVSISPAVSGTKKTRDPICKGFAFVYLGSMQAANTFVQTYSKQNITFGKVQKQITCEIATPSKPITVRHNSISTPGMKLQPIDSDPEDEDEDITMDSDSEDEDIALESTEVIHFDEESAIIEAVKQSVADISLSEPDASTKTSDSSPLKQQKKKPAVKKKRIVKGKSESPPKSNIPGSTKRLKVKEKAVLAGVFSKYGAKG